MGAEESSHGEYGIDELGAGPRDAPGVGAVAAERIAATGVWRAAWDPAEHAALVATSVPGGGRGGAGSGVHRSARAGKRAAALSITHKLRHSKSQLDIGEAG